MQFKLPLCSFQPIAAFLDCAAGDYYLSLYKKNALNDTTRTELAELIILGDFGKDASKV